MYAEQAVDEVLLTMAKVRQRAQKIGALALLPFFAMLIVHAIYNDVPLFLASFAAFFAALPGIARIPKTRDLAMREAYQEYAEYYFLFPLFLSITLLTSAGFFGVMQSLVLQGIATLGQAHVAFAQFLGSTFLSAILDNNIVADFASRGLHGLDIRCCTSSPWRRSRATRSAAAGRTSAARSRSSRSRSSSAASLAGARAQTAMAQKAVDDTVIRAPFAGYVSARPIAAGQYVALTAKIATVLLITPIKLQLQVPEASSPQMRLGGQAEANVPGYPGRKFLGKVTSINPAVDPNSRTLTVEVEFPNTDIALKPGMFATGRILLAGTGEGIFVPNQAVLTDPSTNSSQVFFIRDGKARVAVVQVGPKDGGLTQILSGISSGAEVALDHLNDLYDGQSVKTRPSWLTRGSAGTGPVRWGRVMHKLAELCVRRPVFATMLIVALMVVGGFSFSTLGVDLFPKIDLPTVSVTVSNPGSSAEEVETEITKRIEDAVNTISGIDRFELDVGRRDLLRGHFVFARQERRRGGAGSARQGEPSDPDLPETAKAPVVQKFDPDATPILQMAISSPRPLREVTEIADKQIKPRLENINGVGEIQLVGGLKREIRVWVDPDKMRAYNLSVAEVANSLRQQNMELPAGNMNAGATEWSVRTLGRLVDPAQFDEIAIATRGPYVVKLRDIGHAEDSEEEPTTAARLNGDPAVTLVVSKQSGQNTVATADAIKKRLKEIEPLLPKDIHIQMVNDQSIFIKNTVHALESHLIEGSFLAAFIVFIFLANIRTTLISAVAIPTSIVSTFALMAVMGFALNQITMLALTLMVGIVIDDAIIVLENIYRYMEEKGMPPFRGRDRGNARNRPGGDGHHAVADGRVPADRLHGRHRRPLHVVVRIHGRVRHRGLVAGVLHPDADAVLAVCQGSATEACRVAGRFERVGLLPFPGSLLHQDARVGHGAPQIDGGHQPRRNV